MSSAPDMTSAVDAIEATRRPNRSPEAMTALAGRIRSLQCSKPVVTGEARTAVLAELALLQLQLERLVLSTWRSDTDHHQLLANTFSLAERVDQIARLWPKDTRGNLAVATAHRPLRHDPDRKAA